jgi:acyl-CoA synthetase (AMP-forming)/AMP-acid ligase II
MRPIEPAVTSLSDVLAQRSAKQPHRRAYTFLESGEQESGHLTWQGLDERSRSIASAIRERVGPDSRVLLLFPPGLAFIAALFGAFRARVIAVPAYPPSGARSDRVASRLRGTVADAGIELVLTTAAVAARADALCAVVPELRSVRWMSVEDVPDGPAAPTLESAPDADDVAFLQYTSGSTSVPRGVMVTHANLLHNLADSARLGLHDAGSVSVSWLPVNHDMGLIQGILQPALSGFSAWLMSPVAFLQRPTRWLQAISTLRATHSGGPNFAFDLCVRRVSEAECDALDLSSWRVAFSGSEPVRSATIDAFERAFSRSGFRRQAFRPAYGLAESTLLVTSTLPCQAPRTLRLDTASLRQGRVVSQRRESADRAGSTSLVVGCGWTGHGTRVEIVDPATGRRRGRNEVGEIWVRGGSVARGYWRRPDDTRAAFDAHLADTGEGQFLRTGDLGFVHDGELFVTGRIKDVMIVRGLKHDPHDVELTVEAADPAIRPGGSAAFTIDTESEAVGIAAEVEPRHADHDDDLSGRRAQLMDTIRSAVAAAHGIQLAAVVLLAPGVLPKTTSGKIQRYVCREGLRSGTLTVIARWHAPDADWPLERTA